MRLLLDTHIVLWSLHEPARLGESRTLQARERPNTGFEWLDFTAAEAMLLKQMPYHHKDPFDRMLVAQCLSLDLPLMSDDTRLGAYGCRLV